MSFPPAREIALHVALAVSAMSVAAQAADSSPVRVQLDSVMKLKSGRAQPANDAASFVTADQIEGNPEDELHLVGNAEIRRGGSVLRADRITYVQETDEVIATGNARISGQGASFSGPSMRFRITSREGSMEDAEWEYAPRNLRGCARNIRFVSGDRTTFEDVTLTTCKRDDESWFIKLNNLEIDEYDQTASGTGASLHFLGVPIFGSPWFSFPISKERRSGFLTPTYGMSSTRGVDVSVPYYFNLAPNYDYTFTPRLMSKRGVMLGNEARLKLRDLDAEVGLDYMPEDQETNEDRWGLRTQADFSKGKFGAHVNYNRVSDDDFISDFSGNIRESSESVLPQDYELTYTEKYWNAAVRVQKNQTLLTDDIDYVQKPYEREPQVEIRGYDGDFHGFEVATVLDATRFKHPDRIGGSRFVVDQQVAYPMQGAGWFVIPKGQFIGAWYDLTDLKGSGYVNDSPSRMSPIFSLDSGLVFERDTNWLGRDAFQTLEPRVFYAWSPYRDQSDIPIFDTSISDLNFATLFTENVFSGYDRVSEANQVSLVLSTRYIDKASGLELFRASIGQRQYFRDQRVQFLNTDEDRLWYKDATGGDGRREDVRSDLLSSVGARLSKTVTASAVAQYSSAENRFVKANTGIQWSPRPMSSLGLFYRYNTVATDPDDRIKQVDFAMQWPLTDRLYGLFRYNYSLYRSKPIEVIGGFEYLHDCWTLRFAAQRYTTASNEQESNFFLQLELSGLGSIGTSPLSELRRNIKSYQTRDTVPGITSPYDYYE